MRHCRCSMRYDNVVATLHQSSSGKAVCNKVGLQFTAICLNQIVSVNLRGYGHPTISRLHDRPSLYSSLCEIRKVHPDNLLCYRQPDPEHPTWYCYYRSLSDIECVPLNIEYVVVSIPWISESLSSFGSLSHAHHWYPGTLSVSGGSIPGYPAYSALMFSTPSTTPSISVVHIPCGADSRYPGYPQ